MMVKLSEAFDLQMGKTPARANGDYWNGGTNHWVSISDLSGCGKYVEGTKERITDRAVEESGIKAVPPNTVIMSFKLSLGKTAITRETVYTNEAVMAFIPNGRHDIFPDYFYYMFSGRDWSQATNRAVKGATLNKAAIGGLRVEIPPLDRQMGAAAVLDKVSGLIGSRRRQLDKLEELVQARFVEMFGDPELNPMKWRVVPITEVVRGTVRNGFFAKRDEYCENGNVQVLGVANIVNRMYSKISDLPRANGTEADIEKYQVRYGDILFCRSSLVAEGIGKASVVPCQVPPNILFECHVIRLPLDIETCVPEFLQVLSATSFFRKQMIAQSKTATMTTISQDGILKAKIVLPPIEMQRRFLKVIERLEVSKSAIQQSLAQLEQLKRALMQRYFG